MKKLEKDADIAIAIRAVESDFKKSNKSRMPIIRFSDFIRFFSTAGALVVITV